MKVSMFSLAVSIIIIQLLVRTIIHKLLFYIFVPPSASEAIPLEDIGEPAIEILNPSMSTQEEVIFITPL